MEKFGKAYNHYDLGSGFSYRFFQWSPDRRINRQHKGIPNVKKAGIILCKDGVGIGSCWFDLPETRAIPKNKGPFWKLVSLEPLHLEPSIQTHEFEWGHPRKRIPAYHGFIRDGKWVSA